MSNLGKIVSALAIGLVLQIGAARAQDVEEMPGATRVVPVPQLPVAGLVKRDGQTVAFALPGKTAGADGRGAELLVHDFDFNGDPVGTDKVHLRQVAPGVVEITSVAYEVGYWHFEATDAASYYGLGERFDQLDHAHTVVKNLSMDDEGVKGDSTYKPIPFFMSTSGYGLWVDTTGEATFDMNASDRDVYKRQGQGRRTGRTRSSTISIRRRQTRSCTPCMRRTTTRWGTSSEKL